MKNTESLDQVIEVIESVLTPLKEAMEQAIEYFYETSIKVFAAVNGVTYTDAETAMRVILIREPLCSCFYLDRVNGRCGETYIEYGFPDSARTAGLVLNQVEQVFSGTLVENALISWKGDADQIIFSHRQSKKKYAEYLLKMQRMLYYRAHDILKKIFLRLKGMN